MTNNLILSTQEKIYDAFGMLLFKKEFKKIRVSEIINIADINRSTFYVYFDDKFDLLQKYIQTKFIQFYIKDFNITEKNIKKRIAILTEMLILVKGNANQFKLLCKNVGEKKFVDFFENCIDNIYDELSQKDLLPHNDLRQFTAKFLFNGVIWAIKWWVFTNNDLKAEEVAIQICNIYDSIYSNG